MHQDNDSVNEKKLFTGIFFALIGLRNPVRLLSSVWNNFNITSDDSRRLSTILGLPTKSYLEPVVDALNAYFEDIDPDEDEEEDDSNTQPSFMLDFFGFREQNMPYTFLVLIMMFVVYRILGYIILRGKVREIRLS